MMHTVQIDKDDLGWIEASCDCGWSNGPFIAVEDAFDSFGDHRVAMERIEWNR